MLTMIEGLRISSTMAAKAVGPARACAPPKELRVELTEHDLQPSLGEVDGCGQAGKTGANDDDTLGHRDLLSAVIGFKAICSPEPCCSHPRQSTARAVRERSGFWRAVRARSS
jgi:hypothetical protein